MQLEKALSELNNFWQIWQFLAIKSRFPSSANEDYCIN